MEDHNISDAQISALHEELRSLRSEYRALVECITVNGQATASPASDSNAQHVEELETKLEQLRRIIGNFHPTADSLTYAELYNKCQHAQEKLEAADSALQTIQKEKQTLQAHIHAQAQELMHLRSVASIGVPATDSSKENITPVSNVKNHGRFWKRNRSGSEQNTSVVTELSEEQKAELLRKRLLLDHSFTDEQIAFLVDNVISSSLPVSAQMLLADPRLSPNRMDSLLRLLCAQRGISTPEQAQNTPADNPMSNSADTRDTPDRSARQTPLLIPVEPASPNSDEDDGSNIERLRSFATRMTTLRKEFERHGR